MGSASAKPAASSPRPKSGVSNRSRPKSTRDSSGIDEAALRSKLAAFYSVYDPDALKSPNNVALEASARLGLSQGVDALNSALHAKYQRDLNFGVGAAFMAADNPLFATDERPRAQPARSNLSGFVQSVLESLHNDVAAPAWPRSRPSLAFHFPSRRKSSLATNSTTSSELHVAREPDQPVLREDAQAEQEAQAS
jgi:hypothetical protein